MKSIKQPNIELNLSHNRSQFIQIGHLKGHGYQMKSLIKRLIRLAPTSLSILIQGETGSGKELCAQAIHQSSLRSQSPLISVNCASIPSTLLSTELFGSVSSAYTNAANRKGLIQSADGGTLFLDEVGDLSLEAQAALLRVLESGEMRSIGSDITRRIDIRLICASHKDLKNLIQKNRFREDLYHRISGATVLVPPLRDRLDDLSGLIFDLSPHLYSRLQGCAWKVLKAYAWPGNVRQLKNILECVDVEFPNEKIYAHHLPFPSSGPWRSLKSCSFTDRNVLHTIQTDFQTSAEAEEKDEKIILPMHDDKYLITGPSTSPSGSLPPPPPVPPMSAVATEPLRRFDLKSLNFQYEGVKNQHVSEYFSCMPKYTLQEMKIQYTKYVMEKQQGNVSKTARILNVSRNAVYRLIQGYKYKKSA